MNLNLKISKIVFLRVIELKRVKFNIKEKLLMFYVCICAGAAKPFITGGKRHWLKSWSVIASIQKVSKS